MGLDIGHVHKSISDNLNLKESAEDNHEKPQENSSFGDLSTHNQ